MATLRAVIAKTAESWRVGIANRSPIEKALKSFKFKTGYYNQIGLLWHDVIPHSPAVKEAFRRLPREENEARDFRMARAFLLSGNKSILPESEWTKLEDDIPYLTPYIDLINKEEADKSDWNYFDCAETYI